MTELEEWPICFVRGCGDEFPPGRAAIGYTTCLKHSDRDPLNTGKVPLVIADVNKSNPTIVRDIGILAPQFTGHKGHSDQGKVSQYMRLGSTKGESRNNNKLTKPP